MSGTEEKNIGTQDNSGQNLSFGKMNDYAQLKAFVTSEAEKLHMPHATKDKLLKNIAKHPEKPTVRRLEELKKAALVINILSKLDENHQKESLHGAHVMISDDGGLYNALLQEGLIKKRPSSHHNSKKIDQMHDASLQAGEIFREFLVGKTSDGKSWFQLEAHSLGGARNAIGHLIDYIKYKATGKNVGQYGLSAHIDTNPIEIEKIELPNLRDIVSRDSTEQKSSISSKIRETFDAFKESVTKLIDKFTRKNEPKHAPQNSPSTTSLNVSPTQSKEAKPESTTTLNTLVPPDIINSVIIPKHSDAVNNRRDNQPPSLP